MHMKAIVPMLVMVVTVFILCWTPILIFEVTRKIVRKTDITIDLQSTIENIFKTPCPGAPGLRRHRGAGVRDGEAHQDGVQSPGLRQQVASSCHRIVNLQKFMF